MRETRLQSDRRKSLTTVLQIAGGAVVFAGWLWATWGIDSDEPHSPLYEGLESFVLAALAVLALTWIVLALRDGRRARSADRAAGALGRVTNQARSPRDHPRPVLSALLLPVIAASAVVNLLPDFLALLAGPDPLKAWTAGASLTAGTGLAAWVLVADLRRQLLLRRSLLAG